VIGDFNPKYLERAMSKVSSFVAKNIDCHPFACNVKNFY